MHFKHKVNVEATGWETPKDGFLGKSKWTLANLISEFKLTLDPCAIDAARSCCKNFFTPEQDGLKQEWNENFFFNPPYDNVEDWLLKAIQSCEKYKVIGVGLLPSYTGEWWFHEYILPFATIRWIKGRVKFWENGEPGTKTPNFYSMLCIWRFKG